MDELYSLCHRAINLKFDYSEALESEKENIKDWIREIYYNYEDECNSNVLYSMVLDVQDVMHRLGHNCIYTLDENVLTIKIVF